ncbi:hypothetical protein GCM10009602_18230 [Nocardiopsis tropica]
MFGRFREEAAPGCASGPSGRPGEGVSRACDLDLRPVLRRTAAAPAAPVRLRRAGGGFTAGEVEF